MVNFRANLISPVMVKKTQDYKNYSPQTVSFVEMEPASKADLKAMNKTMKNWGGNNYAWDIYNFFVESAEMQDRFEPEGEDKKRFFAITSQNSDLKNLVYDKILALALVIDQESSIILDFLQVDPDHDYFSLSPSYKGIGSAVVNALKNMFLEKDILLKSVPSAIEFYEKLGFNLVDKMGHMIYKR